jgi:hypothetical protein
MYIAERMFLRWHKKTFWILCHGNIYQGFRVRLLFYLATFEPFLSVFLKLPKIDFIEIS